MSEKPTGWSGDTGSMKGGVSVIIPCFNHGEWLAGTIESVLRQTAQPTEIIVVDDGSTDDTAAVCRRYESVHYEWQVNGGLSAARNRGLQKSSGEFVCFLDADDLLMPVALARGLEAMAQNPGAAFVYGSSVRIDASGNPLGEWRVRPETANYRSLLQANQIVNHGAVLFRRQCLLSIGGYDEALRASEDYDVYLKLASQFPIACYSHFVARFRRHGGNMSRDYERMLESVLAVLHAQERHVQDSDADRRALRIGMMHYRAIYGRPLIAEALRSLFSPQEPGAALRKLALVAKVAPATYAEATLAGIRSWLAAGERRLPMTLRAPLRRALGLRPPSPRLGAVRFGHLRRTSPIDPDYGFGRGKPVDRVYIEEFLARNSDAIRGRVLEIKNNRYTVMFGGGRVTQSDVLDLSDESPYATVVGDLTNAPQIGNSMFDCVVLTQTLHLIFDMPTAVATLQRILKPGGVLLLTVPGISQVDRGEWGESYWHLTRASLRRLLGAGWSEVAVEHHGNVLSASAFLFGLASEDLTREELEAHDPAYPVIVSARATKAAMSAT